MAKQYESQALAMAHETAQGLANAGVMAKRTMKAFDETYLTPVEDMPPEKIRALRPRPPPHHGASRASCSRNLLTVDPVRVFFDHTPPLRHARTCSGHPRVAAWKHEKGRRLGLHHGKPT